ncbi:Xanthine dehydrogenase, iron-sulfur cluster and FAD-binding subunit A [Thauera humireducens]|uniref:xanthine dehydrogenase small subunit n=1 Tax=Thauera humireducens TaxID=1134435 RepID=UPI002467A4AF|nr:xanthine dehydrogenase small subunit [Thauera humireducens]CAH1745400.1 Xanthine dehydrogenase, iron-sulfur cluster and FAD-binding subunit A [Thauera humireducens]
MNRAAAPSRPIRLLLNDEAVEVADCAPSRSLLAWLRESRGLPGTKEGCAEGDCGACTVVVGELDPSAPDGVRLAALNACIQFLPALDGKAVFTVEGIRAANGGLHPAQQAMIDCHGSQCGFCTPGFVMSLWAHYTNASAEASRPPTEAARSALSGNLCRCTGYRPILDAAQRMFELPAAAFDRAALRDRLRSLDTGAPLDLHHPAGRFRAPRTLDALLAARAESPDATLLAGCTDIGLWVTKQLRDLADVIHLGAVDELKRIDVHDGRLRIGAGASLTAAWSALVAHWPQLAEIAERFASPPIRNAGTLGGNVANGSPIGDSMPALIALGASVELASVRGRRRLPLEALYMGYRQTAMMPDELLATIEVPLPDAGQVFRSYKLAKRFDSDISAVCAAFALRFAPAASSAVQRIDDARIAFGGMAATPRRAAIAEAALAGQPWCEATVRAAMAALDADYAPLTDLRASADYRRRVARNLLWRFWLETRPQAPLPGTATRVSALREGAPR